MRAGLESFVDLTAADEIMAASAIYDQAARVRSYEILAEVAADVVPVTASTPEAALTHGEEGRDDARVELACPRSARARRAPRRRAARAR